MDMTEFERGARAAVEAMDLYFRDENEYPIYDGITDRVLADAREGAVADALRDQVI